MKIIGNINLDIRPSVNRFIAKEIKKYVAWLEVNHSLPKELRIIVTGVSFIRSIDHEHVSSTFWAPFDKEEACYMKISTGDFWELEKWGKDSAIYSTLNSISHELIHYHQWLEDKELHGNETDKKATLLTNEYVEYRGFPHGENRIHRWGWSGIPKYRKYKKTL